MKDEGGRTNATARLIFQPTAITSSLHHFITKRRDEILRSQITSDNS